MSGEINLLAKVQADGNRQRVLRKTENGYKVVEQQINSSICKAIDEFLSGKSNHLFDVDKFVSYLENKEDGILSMGCGAILSKMNNQLCYRRSIPIEGTSSEITHQIALEKDGTLSKEVKLTLKGGRGMSALKEQEEKLDFYHSMGFDEKRIQYFENNFKEIALGLAFGKELSQQAVEIEKGKTK